MDFENKDEELLEQILKEWGSEAPLEDAAGESQAADVDFDLEAELTPEEESAPEAEPVREAVPAEEAEPVQEEAPAQEAEQILPEAEMPAQSSPEKAEKTPGRNKKRIIALILAVVLVLGAVGVFLVTQFAFVGGSMYSVKSEALDLRGVELTEEDYLKLAQRMPQCDITWDVPFQGGKVDSSSAELAVTALTEEDIRVLDYVTGLKTVNGEGCQDYLLLAQLQQHRKDITVRYSVPLAGGQYPQDTRELALESFTAEDARLLPALLQLNKLEVSNCTDYALLQKLQAEQPQWNVTYTVALGEESFAWDSTEVTATNVTGAELAEAMTGLPYLKTLDLKNPMVEHAALQSLRDQYAGVKLNWTVELFGQTFTEETTEIDISGNLVESCEDVEKYVSCLPNLKKLIMSDCGIDSETMSQFRERQRPNYKVVWTVYIGEICRVRTDEIFFHPIQQGEYYMWDEDTPELKYCEDMVCLDIGHHKIRNIDFCRYMPELKYLILAHTLIRDVSALVDCQKLIFLEVNWSELRDYSPLVELKALEDLNLHRTYADITPLLEMKWLKNLWVPGRSYTEKLALMEALPDTHLELYSHNTRGWRHLPNYYDMRDLLGMRYMTQ